jgi:hypothetical protein
MLPEGLLAQELLQVRAAGEARHQRHLRFHRHRRGAQDQRQGEKRNKNLSLKSHLHKRFGYERFAIIIGLTFYRLTLGQMTFDQMT